MPALNHIADTETCPCSPASATAQTRRRSYTNCCKPWHTAGFSGLGATPETTMRSRYSAYVLHDAEYLLATWHPSTRPAMVEFSTDIEWHGLTVIAATGASLDRAGTVEFAARFRRDDAHLELHELSSFSQDDGRWFYVDGKDPETTT